MGNHFIMPLLCSFDISLTAHSLIHKDEIRVGLFFSGACSLSSLLSWIINLCQSLFCSLQVTRSPFEISLLGTVSLLILSLCLHLVHLHLTHSYFFSPPPPTSLFWPQLYLCPSLSLLLKTCSGCFTWSSQRIHINSICFHSMFLFLFVYICQSSWASNPVRAHHLPSPKLS